MSVSPVGFVAVQTVGAQVFRQSFELPGETSQVARPVAFCTKDCGCSSFARSVGSVAALDFF